MSYQARWSCGDVAAEGVEQGVHEVDLSFSATQTHPERVQDTHCEVQPRCSPWKYIEEKSLPLVQCWNFVGSTLCMSILESIWSLIKFVQSWSVFVSNFVAVVKICQAEIHVMNCDTTTSSYLPIFSCSLMWSMWLVTTHTPSHRNGLLTSIMGNAYFSTWQPFSALWHYGGPRHWTFKLLCSRWRWDLTPPSLWSNQFTTYSQNFGRNLVVMLSCIANSVSTWSNFLGAWRMK